jgi:hypothetical protein
MACYRDSFTLPLYVEGGWNNWVGRVVRVEVLQCKSMYFVGRGCYVCGVYVYGCGGRVTVNSRYIPYCWLRADVCFRGVCL